MFIMLSLSKLICHVTVRMNFTKLHIYREMITIVLDMAAESTRQLKHELLRDSVSKRICER